MARSNGRMAAFDLATACALIEPVGVALWQLTVPVEERARFWATQLDICVIEAALQHLTSEVWQMRECSVRGPDGCWYRVPGTVAERAAAWAARREFEPFEFALNVQTSALPVALVHHFHEKQPTPSRREQHRRRTERVAAETLREMARATQEFRQEWAQGQGRKRPLCGWF